MQDEKLMIVYSLTTQEGVPWVFPSAWLVSVDKYDQPAYIQAAAIRSILPGYLPAYNREVHDVLITLCEEMQPQAIEDHLNKNKKKKESLLTLFGDARISKSVQSMIDRRMVRFLELCEIHKVVLCKQLKRKIKAWDVALFFSEEPLTPLLRFVRTQTGIQYSLRLGSSGEQILPSEHQITILADHPARLIIDNHIFQLDGLNSAKLKPFLKNQTLFIPDRLSRDYFSGFIRDVVGRAQVEADGFGIVRSDGIQSVSLSFSHDFLANRYRGELIFDYGGATFSSVESVLRKNRIHFGDDNDILLKEYVRDSEAERGYTDLLLRLGFTADGFGRFFYGEAPFATLEWASVHSAALQSALQLVFPEIDGKQLSPVAVTARMSVVLEKDWFDLQGEVTIGEEVIPLHRLFPYIKQGNPLFPLANGLYAIIPSEYFARFEPILSFAVPGKEAWQLAKMHAPLLQSQGFDVPASTVSDDIETDVAFMPSSSVKATLRPYQLEGVRWLVQHRNESLGACLADDMGLGKTLQTLALLADTKERMVADHAVAPRGLQLDLFGETVVTGRASLAALIVVPASLVTNWYNECRKYVPSFQVLAYRGTDRKKSAELLTAFDIIITTYQTAMADVERLSRYEFSYLVVDESQYIRNKNSQAFRKLFQLKAKYKLSLSGTPIENSLADLWAQMEFINPSILGAYEFFRRTFQEPIEKKRDEEALKKLKTLVTPYILRRTKEQVAPDLPELTEEVRVVELSPEQRRVYTKEKSAIRNHLLGLDRGDAGYHLHVLTALMRLRQMASHPVLCDTTYEGDSGKFEEVTATLDTIVAAQHKVLVFSSFVTHLTLYAEWLRTNGILFEWLTGDSSSAQRDVAVQRFQTEKDVCVFLLSLKAGGTGLNLTAADYVLILDPWWNPFAEKQAVARAHRIGRLKNVMVIRFISGETIEEKILTLQSKKAQLSDDLLDIGDLTPFTDGELDALIDG